MVYQMLSYPFLTLPFITTVYTQVKLPPLIPPMYLGETGKISSLPFIRGGLGWGNLRNNSDSITCVYTVGYIGGKPENQVPSFFQCYQLKVGTTIRFCQETEKSSSLPFLRGGLGWGKNIFNTSIITFKTPF